MSGTNQIQAALLRLEQILKRQKERGRETVAIARESLDRLARLPVNLRAVRPPFLQNVSSPPPPVAVSTGPPVFPRSTSPALPGPPVLGAPSAPEKKDVFRFEQRGRVEILHPDGETKRERMVQLFFAAKNSGIPGRMPTLRDQMVFSRGNVEARIVLVGEAPGDEEEKLKKPFVGPAGKKLDDILKVMGLNSETDVYISNIVKFRPKIGDGRFQGARNRKPTPDEMAACVSFVRSEIEVIQPKVIVALGGTAAEGLLDLSGSVTGMRGKLYELDGIPTVVTYHPAYLLRVEGGTNQEQALTEKRKVWEDMLTVMEILGLPISEKQRGFFKK